MKMNVKNKVAAWTMDDTGAKPGVSPHSKFLSKRMSETSKLKVETGGAAKLSGIADDTLEAPFPDITIDQSLTGSEEVDGTLIRVTSAHQSQTLDSTSLALNGRPEVNPEPSEEFQIQLEGLVNEITNKVLIDQPENIYEFLADYLEDRVKVERKKCKTKKRHKGNKGRVLRRGNSQLAMQGVDDGDRKLSLDIPSRTADAAGASPDVLQVDFGVPDTCNVCTVTGSSDVVTQCSFFKNYIIWSSEDSNIRIDDVNTGKHKLTLPNHKPVNCFVIVPIDDRKILILIGSADGQVPGWRVKFGAKCSAKFTVLIPMHQPNPIRALSMSPRGKYLASGCCFEMTQISLWGELGTTVRGTLKTWDMDSIINYVDHPQHYYDDVEHIALKTYKQIIARSTATGQKAMSSYARLSATRDEEANYGIRAIAFTPDDSKILVGFGHPTESSVKDMKMLALLEAKTLETLWLQYGYFYQINNIISSPEKGAMGSGPWVFMVGTEFYLNKCTVEIRPGEGNKVRVKFPWRVDFDYGDHKGGTYSPDGALVATACGCNLIVFKACDGQQVAFYEGHTRPIQQVCFSDDGKYIATASSDKTVKIWNAPQKVVGLVSLSSPRPSSFLSPKPSTKDGIGNPISLSPNLYQARALSPAESEYGSLSVDPNRGRRLSRQDPRELAPSAYGFRSRSHSPNLNAFEKTLNHLHITAERSRSPAPDVRNRIGEKVTS